MDGVVAGKKLAGKPCTPYAPYRCRAIAAFAPKALCLFFLVFWLFAKPPSPARAVPDGVRDA